MPVENDDRGYAIYGNNVQALRFYDDQRVLRATIYLDENNRLNVGDLRINTSTGGTGGGAVDLSAIAFVTIAESPLLTNERILTQGDGLVFSDGGGGAAYTIGVNGTVVRTTRQIISGNGLTGGGDLSADRTLAVGAGDGITVAADSVAVDGTVVRTTRALTAGTLLGGGGSLAADRTFNVELHHVILLGAAGTTAEYAATDAGLTAALAAAVSGDVVILPACTISGTGWTVGAGVELRGPANAILAGQVTLGAGAHLVGLTITIAADDAGNVTGVTGPASGTAYLRDVAVSVTNAGAGVAYGVTVDAGDVSTHACSIESDEYAVYISAAGALRDIGSRFSSSSASTVRWVTSHEGLWSVHSVDGVTDAQKLVDGTGTSCSGAQFGTSVTLDLHNALRIDAVRAIEALDLTVYGSNDLSTWTSIAGWKSQSIDGDCYGIYATNRSYSGLGQYWRYVRVVADGGVARPYLGRLDLYTTAWATADISNDPSHIELEASHVQGAAEGVISAWSDRSAWDVDLWEERHASDIDAGILTRHLPTSGSAGQIVIDQGAEWQSKPLSGDASLSSGGALTLGLNVVGNTKFRQSAGLSVVGTAGSAAGNVADITASADGQVLRRSSGVLGFGAVDLTDSDAITGILPVVNGGTGGSAGAVSGSGTAGYVARFTGASTIGNGILRDSGSSAGLGTANYPSGGGAPVYVLAQASSAPTGAAADTTALYALDRFSRAGTTSPHALTEDARSGALVLETAQDQIRTSRQDLYVVAGGKAAVDAAYLKWVNGNLQGVVIGTGYTGVSSARTFSLSCWAYLNTYTSSAAIRYIFLQQAATNVNVLVYATNTGTIRFSIGNGSANVGTFTSSSYMTEGAWHHLVFVFNGNGVGNSGRMQVYVDGQAVTLSFSGTIPTDTSDLTAGTGRIGYGAAATSWDGGIRQFGVYSSALTQADAINLYRGTDVSTNRINYWPMSEGAGSTCYDLAGSTDATIASMTWAQYLGQYAGTPKELVWNGNLAVAGGIRKAWRAVSASTTLLDTDYRMACTAGSAGITLTLPPAAAHSGREYRIKKVDNAGGYVTVDGNGSETIDGQLTKVIQSQWTSMTIYCDGTQWLID